MNNQQGQKKKEAYTKPELFTHEPLRNITAMDSAVPCDPKTNPEC